MKQLNLREVEIYRPYTTEAPEEMLWAAGASEACVDDWLSCDMLRVAKRGDDVLGMYAMNTGDGVSYELLGLVVAARVRKQGLGRWLVGHAIGVAESKGARQVNFAAPLAPRFFQRIGFVSCAQEQRFDLIPE